MSTDSLEYMEHSKAKLRDLNPRFQFMLATMLVVLAASVYQFYKLYQMNGLISDAEAGDLNAAMSFQKLTERNVVDYLVGVVGIANVVAICMFLYLAAKNVYEYFNGATQYTPGWIAGWFFIPVAHIFMPFLVVRELSRGTVAMTGGKDSADIPHQPVHPTMMLWGIIWILQATMSYLLILYPFTMINELVGMKPDEVQLFMLSKTYYFSVAATALGLISGISLLFFAARIKSEQNAYRAN